MKTILVEEEFEINGRTFYNLLLVNGYIEGNELSVDAYIEVPRGGDYSGMNLDIDDCPIKVKTITKSCEK